MKKKMKKAFSENHSFTRFNLNIIISFYINVVVSRLFSWKAQMMYLMQKWQLTMLNYWTVTCHCHKVNVQMWDVVMGWVHQHFLATSTKVFTLLSRPASTKSSSVTWQMIAGTTLMSWGSSVMSIHSCSQLLRMMTNLLESLSFLPPPCCSGRGGQGRLPPLGLVPALTTPCMTVLATTSS